MAQQRNYYAAGTSSCTTFGQLDPWYQSQNPYWDEPTGPAIDESLLSVQDERDEKAIRIEYRQLACRCKFTSLIRLEYSTKGDKNDYVVFKCPACGDEDKIVLHKVHPDGANIRIIDTWKSGTEVKWDKDTLKTIIPAQKETLQIHQVEVIDAHVFKVPYTHQKEFRVHFVLDERTIQRAKSHKNLLTLLCDKISEHIYNMLSGGLY